MLNPSKGEEEPFQALIPTLCPSCCPAQPPPAAFPLVTPPASWSGQPGLCGPWRYPHAKPAVRTTFRKNIPSFPMQVVNHLLFLSNNKSMWTVSGDSQSCLSRTLQILNEAMRDRVEPRLWSPDSPDRILCIPWKSPLHQCSCPSLRGNNGFQHGVSNNVSANMLPKTPSYMKNISQDNVFQPEPSWNQLFLLKTNLNPTEVTAIAGIKIYYYL